MLTTQGNIATKKKDIEKLKTSTKNAAVTSPVNGEVQSINADGGTDNNGNALPFMTVVETGGFRVKGYVNENNASAPASATRRGRAASTPSTGTTPSRPAATTATATPPCPASTPSM